MALCFPGQGAQRPGMGASLHADFASARHVFEEIDAALDERLSRLMFEGDAAELNLTANTQPALLAHSIATLAVLRTEFGEDALGPVVAVMGHSVGEYAALVAAGALGVADAARLLRIRGAAMQAAADARIRGDRSTLGMRALLLHKQQSAAAVSAAVAAAVAESDVGAIINVASVNSPSQVVLSGDVLAMDAVTEVLIRGGVVARAVSLPVSAPFHCDIMLPAAAALAAAMGVVDWPADDRPPPPSPPHHHQSGNLNTTVVPPLPASHPILLARARVPLICNATAADVQDPADAAAALLHGVTRTVRWRDCVDAAVARHGVTHFLELGCGSTLAGLVRQTSPRSTSLSLGSAYDVGRFATQLKQQRLHGLSGSLAALLE